MTETEYINREIELWGEEEISNLLNQGFEPVLLTSPNGGKVWRWLIKPESAKTTLTVR